MDLVEKVYEASRALPAEERFGLASQMQRAAVSVPSNIAEGHSRKATGAFLNHLSIAAGSLAELETQVHVAKRLGYIGADVESSLLGAADEIGRMLSGLRSSLDSRC